MSPLTDTYPKPMMRINGKPVLEHTINLLKRHGIFEIFINLWHYPTVVIDYFGNGSKFGVNINYSIEVELLGTAGGVKKFAPKIDDTFLVVYGDVLSLTDLGTMINYHKKKSKSSGVVGLYRVNNPHECGLVTMSKTERITGFFEKPDKDKIFTNLVNAGIYVLEPEILNLIPENSFFDFGMDLFPRLLQKGMNLYGFPIRDYLIDIGTIEKYKQAQKEFIGK